MDPVLGGNDLGLDEPKDLDIVTPVVAPNLKGIFPLPPDPGSTID